MLVMDQMLSWDVSSSETALKGGRLGKRWHCLFAAEDTSSIQPIIKQASAVIKDADDESENTIAGVMELAYQKVRRQQIESRILSTYNLTMAQLVERKHRLPPYVLERLHNKVEHFDLGIEFLVAGFASDSAAAPTILAVQNPGEASFDLVGYAAIGTGSFIARNYLERREQSKDSPFELSLYNGIAAKSLSERASNVGPKTLVVVVERVKGPRFIALEAIEQIKQIWLKEEEAVRPENLVPRVRYLLLQGR